MPIPHLETCSRTHPPRTVKRQVRLSPVVRYASVSNVKATGCPECLQIDPDTVYVGAALTRKQFKDPLTGEVFVLTVSSSASLSDALAEVDATLDGRAEYNGGNSAVKALAKRRKMETERVARIEAEERRGDDDDDEETVSSSWGTAAIPKAGR